jgi:hypothetical protein
MSEPESRHHPEVKDQTSSETIRIDVSALRIKQVPKQLGLIKNNPDEVRQGSDKFRNNSD